MQLRLEGVAQQAGSQAYLYPMALAPVPGAVTILLGATQAGKTSLMRVMAGLDRPSAGRVLVDGHDVTGMPVRERNVSMVYQQFINYPSLKVFDNIASPLRLRRKRRPQRLPRACASWPGGCISTTCWTAIRPSSPAGSSSAWHWRARWPRRRR